MRKAEACSANPAGGCRGCRPLPSSCLSTYADHLHLHQRLEPGNEAESRTRSTLAGLLDGLGLVILSFLKPLRLWSVFATASMMLAFSNQHADCRRSEANC